MSTNRLDFERVFPGSDANRMPIVFNTTANTTAIYPGELAVVDVDGTSLGTAIAMTDGAFTSSKKLAGIAYSQSTQTASAAGTVTVTPIMPGDIFKCYPDSVTQWTTSTLPAARFYQYTINETSGVYTVTATKVSANTDIDTIAGGVLTIDQGAQLIDADFNAAGEITALYVSFPQLACVIN